MAMRTVGTMAPCSCISNQVETVRGQKLNMSCAGAEEQIPAIKAEKSEGKGWLKGRAKGKGADSKNGEGHIVADPAKLALLLS